MLRLILGRVEDVPASHVHERNLVLPKRNKATTQSKYQQSIKGCGYAHVLRTSSSWHGCLESPRLEVIVLVAKAAEDLSNHQEVGALDVNHPWAPGPKSENFRRHSLGVYDNKGPLL